MGKGKESTFQSKLIREIEETFPGSIVLKNDAGYRQGFPDLTIFYRDKWAVLETKREKDAHHQPNQDYYVEKLNEMSYSRFIFPENHDEVFDDLKKLFTSKRNSRKR